MKGEPMKNKAWIAGTWAALAGAVVLVACGGGSSGGSGSGTATTSASGIVTGFGSVIVNGREFATGSGTRVVDGDSDDAASSTANLQVGMSVDLDSDGTMATFLRFTSAVRGEIDAIDAAGNALTVLGQTVQLTSGTSFAGSRGAGTSATPITQIGDLKVGDYVVVYGYLECGGGTCGSGATDIVATLVVEPAAAGRYRVQGFVNNFNAMSDSFTLNGLTVDIAAAGMTPTVCMPASCAFANGDFVSVRSNTAPTGAFSATGSTLTLTAVDIRRREQGPAFAVGATVTLEGPVTQLGASGFVVRGVTVDASAASLASTLAGLANNQIVEVTGTVSAGGILVASSIGVERQATLALMGPLDAAPTTTLSVLGQTFGVTPETRFDDRAQDVRPFNASNFATVLQAGDQVLVSGYPSGGSNVATRVERLPAPHTPTAGLQAIVGSDSPSADTLVAAGITVTLNGTTQLFYPGAGNAPSLAGFFTAITPGTTVVTVLGVPGSGTGTVTALDAAAMGPNAHWSR
jgi:hypothetical protein